jgi:VWFA-related protein
MQSRFALFRLIAAILLTCVPLCAEDVARYTIGTDEVQIAFSASDGQGREVGTLHATDVAVVDNGLIVRQFRSFRQVPERPLNLVILIDTSDSMKLQIPDEIAAVKGFVADTTGREQDRVSILTVGGAAPRLICADNCNGEAAAVQLNSLRADGQTPLYDAILQALDILKDESAAESRPAIVVFSDGRDNFSLSSFEDALQAALDLQVVIYTVSPGFANYVLDSLADSTGGLSFSLGKDTAEVLEKIREDLHSGYVLTYVLPERSVGWHTVRVLPTGDPKLQFRSRQAYREMEEH